MQKLAPGFADLAEALENAAAAVRKIEAALGVEAAKSKDEAAEPVAGKSGPKGKKPADAEPVVAAPAKGGKKKVAEPAVTFQDLKAKATELVNLKGTQAVVEIMSNYGLTKLVEADTDDYAKIMAEFVEALVEDEPAGDDAEDLFGE